MRADLLGDLREQIRAATDAPQQRVRDAEAIGLGDCSGEPVGEGAAPPPRTPPAGWQQQASDGTNAAHELLSLVRLLRTLRDVVPPELRHEVTALLRQLLVVTRALIDWMLALLEPSAGGRPIEVHEIPLD